MVPRYFAVLLAAIFLDVAPSPDGCDCDDDDEIGMEYPDDSGDEGIEDQNDDARFQPEDER